jgi:hypothetical protein
MGAMDKEIQRKPEAKRLLRVKALTPLAGTVLCIVIEAALLALYLRPHGYDQRKDYAQVLAGLAAGTVVLVQLFYTSRTLAATESNIEQSRQATLKREEIDRDGQIADRYSRAVEQLANEMPTIRLGGIYALEQIAKDSQKHHWTAMEILTAFLRQQAAGRMRRYIELQSLREGIQSISFEQQSDELKQEHFDRTIEGSEATVLTRTVLEVLGRRTLAHEESIDIRLDLSYVAIFDLGIADWHFERALFVSCNMSRVRLDNTFCQNAQFLNAQMKDMHAVGAYFQDADFTSANLDGARLIRCHFDSTILLGADLPGAIIVGGDSPCQRTLQKSSFRSSLLRDAQFINVYADGADFTGATFDRTTLQNVDFRGAIGLTQQQINGCIFRGEVLLPPGLHGQGEPHPGVPD